MPEQDPTTDPVDDDATESDDVEENEDGDGDAEPEWTPPTREEHEALQAKLKRANEQAKRLREKSKAAPAAPATEVAAADPAEITKWQTRAVRTAAKAELLARGVDADMVDLALGRLDPSKIDFDDDDTPDLLDWIEEMEDKHPKLFKQAPAAPAAPAQRPRPGRVETPVGRAARPKPSLGEQIIANSLNATSRRR